MKKLSSAASVCVVLALVAALWAVAVPAGAAPSVDPGADSRAASSAGAGPAAVKNAAGAQIAQKQNIEKQSAKKKRKKARYKAPKGPLFNNPHSGLRGKYAIERQVIAAINHARKGSYIRIAIYSFDRMPPAQALIRAHRRGVHVQILLNDHWNTKAQKAMRAVLGTNRQAKSFIYSCKQGCRTIADEYRNLHSKFYTFTKTGKSEHVLMVGSANLTRNAAAHQWNDLYVFEGDEVQFKQYINVFKDMKRDYDTRQPPMRFCGTPKGAECDDSVDKHTTWIFPKRSTPKNDLVLDMLNKIQCLTPDGNGGQTRTKLALSMHSLRGARGNYLAAAIRKKWAEGCDFRVSYGLIGYHTKQILGAATSRGRIPLRSSGLDYNPDDDFDLNNDGQDDVILTYYTHQKYFVIQGTYNGRPNTSMVLTGSSNWASLGTAQDEVFFTIKGAKNARAYLKNFNLMWKSKRYTRNAYTTTYTDFRVARTQRQADGSTKVVYETVRRPVTTVEPDPYRPGPFWEND